MRTAIIGSSGAGKSTLARELARRNTCPNVELDWLHWKPGWIAEDAAVFREKVSQALTPSAWVPWIYPPAGTNFTATPVRSDRIHAAAISAARSPSPACAPSNGAPLRRQFTQCRTSLRYAF
jgi:ABC-type hemin transport system ATPase subunit